MFQRTFGRLADQATAPPFLPLAFRFFACAGLMALQLALPREAILPHEEVYLGLLGALWLESLWEMGRWNRLEGKPFATPSLGWVRWNLLLDLALVNLIFAFHGVYQERFATLYIFPVLASAFYLGTAEIVVTGILCSVSHILLVLGFTEGVWPTFGNSGPLVASEGFQTSFVLSFASMQVFGTTLVMVFLRRNLEDLRGSLSASEAVVDELSALHRRVVDAMHSGLVTLDLEGVITSANPAARVIFQRSLPAGLGLSDLLPGTEGILERFGKEPRFEVRYPRADGDRLLGGHLAPLRDKDGTLTGHLMLFQDLTEWKALEERTRTAERLAALGQLSAGLAHELRNPMASVLGCLQLIRNPSQSPEMRERLMGILERECQRVNGLVSEFLDFARPRAPQLQHLFLPSVVETLVSSWDMDPRTHGLALQLPQVPEVWVSADADGLHRALMNLLTNARKAVRQVEAPLVALRAEVRSGAREGRLALRVEDNGCGMTPAQLETLFVPFSSHFEEGTGLGMSLVYQFVQQMGWEIRVWSEEGRGTRVELDLPLASGEDVAINPGDA